MRLIITFKQVKIQNSKVNKMKHLTLFMFAAAIAIGVNAQSEKYVKAMEAQMTAVDTVNSPSGWFDMANTFQRIADAEKTQWLPYYYASLSRTMGAYRLINTPGATKVDAEADAAEELLKKAEAISKDNSEIYVVKKMINTLRMSVDPQNRYMTYGPAAEEALQKAKQLNPANPRVALLEGQDKFYTPEQYGGSKTEAKAIFEDAMKKFDAFKPESSIAPNWGLRQVKWLYAQCK
jgi:hypothetical protein